MPRTTRRKIRRMTALLFVLIVWATYVCGCALDTGKQGAEPAGTPKPISDLTFAGIRQQRKDAQKVEDWEKYRNTLIGQRVQWTGHVLYATEPKKAGGLYEIAVDMDPSGVQFSYDDVTFLLPQDQATRLTKGQDITFQGDLLKIDEMKGTVDLVLTMRFDKIAIIP